MRKLFIILGFMVILGCGNDYKPKYSPGTIVYTKITRQKVMIIKQGLGLRYWCRVDDSPDLVSFREFELTEK